MSDALTLPARDAMVAALHDRLKAKVQLHEIVAAVDGAMAAIDYEAAVTALQAADQAAQAYQAGKTGATLAGYVDAWTAARGEAGGVPGDPLISIP